MPIPDSRHTRILENLTLLYGAEQARLVWKNLETILGDFHRRNPYLAVRRKTALLTERDAILITYGDQFQQPDTLPLQTLHQVLVETLGRVVSGVHILPFFPYSSDDGFSIIDYSQVDPRLGDWTDVERLAHELRLMFDLVINHISRESVWFGRFIAADPAYKDWFIALEPGVPTDWTADIVRPRALPLLTPVQTADGEKLVWTTFSEDQIDLNYEHPPVLLKMIEVLLHYVEKGAQVIRLDAIAYLWKRIGTTSIHLEETHHVVKLMRSVLDAVAPDVILITETNVPHEENISYFGAPLPDTGRTDEAQMVYQFPLAPLVMHSILSGEACTISEWAAGLQTPSTQAAFFNFTASHDGIGLMPVRGLLEDHEIQALVDATLAHGGRVSHKTNPDGSQSVYELNISYFDALSDRHANEPQALQVSRFMVSQAIMLALAGVPGIYVHSLLGSRSWHAGAALTGNNRTINRQKFDRSKLEGELSDPASLRNQVFGAYSRLLRTRESDPAFHPYGGQRVLSLDDSVLAFLRTSPDGTSRVLCLHNVSDQARLVHLYPGDLDLAPGAWHDLLSGSTAIVGDSGLTLPLLPYAVRWLKT
ncbi:alpha-amylase family glycosyl hydrolase [Chloroflexota bacterium]